jgi:hypothetical protein
MVNSGKKIRHPTLAAVNFDGDRIPLPSRFVRYSNLSGSDSVNCWLLVVTAGRYRLTLDADLGSRADENLSRLLEEAEDITTSRDLLAETGSNELASLRARFIPTVAYRMGANWRVTIPKEARSLVPLGEDRSFMYILVVGGFLEFWFPDTLRRAVSVPIEQVLP